MEVWNMIDISIEINIVLWRKHVSKQRYAEATNNQFDVFAPKTTQDNWMTPWLSLYTIIRFYANFQI